MNFKLNSQSNDKKDATSDQKALEQDVQNNKRDIDKFGVDLADFWLDYGAFKQISIKNLLDQAASLEMEFMLARVETADTKQKIDELKKSVANNDSLLNKKFK